jgi:hypothetical protein
MSAEEIRRAFDLHLDAESRSSLDRLHRRVLDDATFSRATPWYDHASRLLQEDRWDEAIRVIERFMPGAFLSPDAHLMLSYSYAQIGDSDRSRLHAFYATTAVDAIALSGTGTRSAPWQVLHVADEYAFLRARGITTESQAMITTPDGSTLDRHIGADGVERWFELVA